jgi:hypothetical protein
MDCMAVMPQPSANRSVWGKGPQYLSRNCLIYRIHYTLIGYTALRDRDMLKLSDIFKVTVLLAEVRFGSLYIAFTRKCAHTDTTYLYGFTQYSNFMGARCSSHGCPAVFRGSQQVPQRRTDALFSRLSRPGEHLTWRALTPILCWIGVGPKFEPNKFGGVGKKRHELRRYLKSLVGCSPCRASVSTPLFRSYGVWIKV